MAWVDLRDGNPVKQRLAAGEGVLGSFVRLPCAEAVEVCAHAGFDLVVIDTEHTPIGDDVAAALVRAAEAAGVTGLVRAVDTHPERLGRLLETGALGVHLPQVLDTEHAAEAIRATKYAPEGVRGLATGRASGYGLRMELKEYVEAANREVLVVVQLETLEALTHVEEIAQLPGCDVVFLGLTDLSVDVGVPGDYSHPTLQRALARSRAAAEEAGVALGAPAASLEMAQTLREQGVRYVTTNDLRLLTDAATAFVERFTRA